MAYDFPATPSNGQKYQGYTFDGEKWIGGFQAQGVSNAEQFFTLDGLTQLDIAVPSWAKMARLTGRAFLGTGVQVLARVSADGTTFPSGASDYQEAGQVQGTAGTLTQPVNSVSGTAIALTTAHDASLTAIPAVISSDLSVWRANTTQQYTARHTGHTLNVSTQGGRAWVARSSVLVALTGIRLAAFRVINSGGTFQTGSYLQVQWIGELAAQPNGVSIVDAPADGAEYVRVNNLWRKKSQTFVLDGLTQLDVDVPATAKTLRLEGVIYWSAINASNALTWRSSTDGTTFQAGASDYFYGGFIHYSGSAGFANLVPSNEAYGRLSFSFDTNTQAVRVRWLFPVVKSTNTNALHTGTVNCGYYNTPATNGYTDAQFSSGVQTAANLSIKKLRFFNGPVGGAFGNDSSITCDWLY